MDDWLKVLRKSSGMTQQAVAQKCEISRQYYCGIEKRHWCPSVSTAKKIANVLGFDDWCRLIKDEYSNDTNTFSESSCV